MIFIIVILKKYEKERKSTLNIFVLVYHFTLKLESDVSII